jgi:hypothetical protein
LAATTPARRVESRPEAQQLRVAPVRALLHPAQQAQQLRVAPVRALLHPAQQARQAQQAQQVQAWRPAQAAWAWRLPELHRPGT